MPTYATRVPLEFPSEDTGSDGCVVNDWLINVNLPNGESDLIIAAPSTPAMQLYFNVVQSASEKLEVGIDDIRSLFAERHYAAYRCSIMDLGMHNCCTVNVEFLHDWHWNIMIDIPDGTSVKIQVEESISPSELHGIVVKRATDYLGVDPDEIYSLYNGKTYRTFKNISLAELGMHDGCSVTVYARLRGGACVANRVGGKRKEVSNHAKPLNAQLSTFL